MVELRTHSERVVRELRRGERILLSYRGELLAELVPAAPAGARMAPLDALRRAQELAGETPDQLRRANAYLRELRRDQKGWGGRVSA